MEIGSLELVQELLDNALVSRSLAATAFQGVVSQPFSAYLAESWQPEAAGSASTGRIEAPVEAADGVKPDSSEGPERPEGNVDESERSDGVDEDRDKADALDDKSQSAAAQAASTPSRETRVEKNAAGEGEPVADDGMAESAGVSEKNVRLPEGVLAGDAETSLEEAVPVQEKSLAEGGQTGQVAATSAKFGEAMLDEAALYAAADGEEAMMDLEAMSLQEKMAQLFAQGAAKAGEGAPASAAWKSADFQAWTGQAAAHVSGAGAEAQAGAEGMAETGAGLSAANTSVTAGEAVPVAPVEGVREAQVMPGRVSGTVSTKAASATPADYAVRTVRYLVSRGEKVMTVRLVPESLGELHVEIRALEDGVAVRLASGNGTVRETLQAEVDGIREALAKNGIEVTEIQVSADSGLSFSTAGQAQDQSAALDKQQQPASSYASSEKDGQDSASGAPRAPVLVHDGALNVLA